MDYIMGSHECVELISLHTLIYNLKLLYGEIIWTKESKGMRSKVHGLYFMMWKRIYL